MDQRDILRKALIDCRWDVMRQLADEAEERGDTLMAAGWRWLAKNRKWPGCRTNNDSSRRIYGWSQRQSDWREYEDTLPPEATALFGTSPKGTLWGMLSMAALYMGNLLMFETPGQPSKF